MHACDVLLVPLIPAMLSVRTYDQLIDFVDAMPGRKPQVMGFLSMVDRRKKAHREFTERLPKDHASVVAEAIPSRVVIEQMAEERAPVPAVRAGQFRDRCLRGALGTGPVARDRPRLTPGLLGGAGGARTHDPGIMSPML